MRSSRDSTAMKAVGYFEPGALDRSDALLDLEVQRPSPDGRDLLVRVAAVSANPVDCKVRMGRPGSDGAPAILGWDAVGTVVGKGDEAQRFNEGDVVWYSGDISRAGSNAEFHIVDERIVAQKPASISDADAAALPLTSLTAWEMLFDRLRVDDPVAGGHRVLLVIGGAGGVGSITIQLARALTDLTVVATASRPETSSWATQMGAHHIINHHEPLAEQIEPLGVGVPEFVFSTTHTASYTEQLAALIAPQGRFGLIDDPTSLDVMPFKQKSVSIHHEMMFTRSMFETADMERQSDILTHVAQLVEAGAVRSTATSMIGSISAENLRTAQAQLESGKVVGKLVLQGF